MSCCVNWLVQGVGVTRSTGTGPRAVVQALNVHRLLLLCPSVLCLSSQQPPPLLIAKAVNSPA